MPPHKPAGSKRTIRQEPGHLAAFFSFLLTTTIGSRVAIFSNFGKITNRFGPIFRDHGRILRSPDVKHLSTIIGQIIGGAGRAVHSNFVFENGRVADGR